MGYSTANAYTSTAISSNVPNSLTPIVIPAGASSARAYTSDLLATNSRINA